MPTPALVVQYYPLAEVYAANAVAKGTLFSPYTDPRLPLMINMEGFALQWKYDYDPTNTTDLVATANYVWAILGKFGGMAQATITSGGSSVTPGTPTVIQSPIYITGANFASATAWNGANAAGVTILAAYTLQVFWNDIQRFLIEGTEWSRTSTGVTILIADFNATTTNLESVFFIYISA